MLAASAGGGDTTSALGEQRGVTGTPGGCDGTLGWARRSDGARRSLAKPSVIISRAQWASGRWAESDTVGPCARQWERPVINYCYVLGAIGRHLQLRRIFERAASSQQTRRPLVKLLVSTGQCSTNEVVATWSVSSRLRAGESDNDRH